ncbi:MAG: dihydroneopterin aldolase [Propionibacteriaceae bacterium]
MNDQIRLSGIQAFGYHGVYPEEKSTGQLFIADVVLELDLGPAGRSDALADTINYAALSEELVAIMEDGSFDLIEALAERLAQHCLSDLRVNAVSVTVHKPQVRLAVPVSDVSITIYRAR